MTDDRGQMTDDRGQMTDDRGQKLKPKLSENGFIEEHKEIAKTGLLAVNQPY